MSKGAKVAARVQGGLLDHGVASWSDNEDAAKSVDLKGYGLDPNEPVTLCVRNGSPTVTLTARYGPLVKCTAIEPPPTGVACVMNNTGETFTSAAHGLKVGDALQFGTTVGGVTAGTTYYVIATSDANTFQVSTARGGSALLVTADADNTYSVEAEQMSQGTLAVAAFTAETSTALRGGLACAVLQGAAAPFRVTLTKSAATAAAFTAFVELRRA